MRNGKKLERGYREGPRGGRMLGLLRGLVEYPGNGGKVGGQASGSVSTTVLRMKLEKL